MLCRVVCSDVGMEVDQVRQLKQLEDENVRLESLAELTLDKTMLQDVLRKILKPSRQKAIVKCLRDGDELKKINIHLSSD